MKNIHRFAIAFAVIFGLGLIFKLCAQREYPSDYAFDGAPVELMNDIPPEVSPPREPEKLRSETEAWINKNFGNSDPKKQIALKKLALAHQYLLAHPEDDSTREAWQRLSSATSCYTMAFKYEEIDDVEVADALAAQVFNTVTRSRVRIDWNNRLRGQVIKPITHDKWEGHCDSL